MRLDRLDLTRFGKFTNHVVDFGARPESGTPDLHIIYGPNEAGKSTLCAAFLDLLYGIGNQTPYAFRHGYGELCIGARLGVAGGPVDLRRIKGKQNTLLDARDAPVPETVLQAALGGIARGSYESMFLLDDATLEKGGEEILRSQGDLGQLLFSASAGLAETSATLDAIGAEADRFHRPRARKDLVLLDMKAELEALDARRAELDTLAPEHARLQTEKETAHAAWQEAQTDADAARTRLARVERLLGAFPLARQLIRLDEALDALPALPEPPVDWPRAYEGLAARRLAAQTRLDAAQAAIRQLEERLQHLVPDARALSLAAAFAEAKALKSGYDEARKDLPKRRPLLEAAEGALAMLVRRLGRADREPASLVLPDDVKNRLRRRAAERSGIEERLARAQAERDAARKRHETARAALDAEGAGPPDALAALARILAGIEAQDPARALALARTRRDESRDTLARRRAALEPWQGDDAALAALVLPTRETIDRFLAERDETARARDHAIAERARTEGEIDRLKASLAATRETGTVGVEEAAEARRAREAAWAAHRTTLDASTADAFEAALRRDDEIAARRLAAGASQGRIAEIAEAIALRRAEHETAERALADADARADALADAIAAEIRDPHLAALPLSALRERAGALDDVRDALDAAMKAERALAEAQAALLEATRTLAAGLAAAGATMDDAPFPALHARAKSLVEAAERTRLRREEAQAAAQALREREGDYSDARTAEASWRADWEGLCAGTWLAEGPLPDAAAMADILALADKLQADLEARNALATRIRSMEANEAAFSERTAALADALGLPAGEPAAIFEAVEITLAQAQTIARDRAQATQALEAQREEAHEHAQDLEAAETALSEMATFFGLPDASALKEALDTVAARRDLAHRREETAEALREMLDAHDIADARAALADVEREALETEKARLSEEVRLFTEEAQGRFARLSDVRRALSAIGDDDAVARIDQQRTALLLAIAEEARAHLALRLGVLAVGEALRRYRDRHRSGMLERAARAFATISRGAYVSLEAQPGKDRQEVLVAIGADGGSKRVSDLSKGTRFQLYLALRVAGYHEFARNRAPVPFVADDIMETFDDDRAAEAFRLLAEMAQVGQVVYLTHHRHLCGIARKTCPGIVVHELG